MAFDQGTTSRCIIFDKAGKIKSMAAKEFTQIYPKQDGLSMIQWKSGHRKFLLQPKPWQSWVSKQGDSFY